MKPVWLVTGASSGVGRSLAVSLASAGCEVILAARSVAALEDTRSWCGPGASVVPMDLSDLPSLAGSAVKVRETLAGRPLAGVIHAAGIMAWTSPATPSGWSRVPAVNAVAPWQLTLALEPALRLSPGARVLFIAGAPWTLGGVRPQASAWLGDRPGQGMRLSLEAAAAKVWMARSLRRRWPGTLAFAFHPGFVRSRLAEGLPLPLSTLGCLAQPFLSSRSKTGEWLAQNAEAGRWSGQLVAGKRGFPLYPGPEDPASEDEFLHQLLG